MSGRKSRRIRHSEMPKVEHAIFHALESVERALREGDKDYAGRRLIDADILIRLYLPEERQVAK